MAAAVEICAETLASVEAARAGGADRVELCTGLALGGLTPSVGLIRRAAEVLPTFVLIRPRPGDFVFTETEIAAMEDDVRAALEAGAAGVVVGALTPGGAVDTAALARLVAAAGGAPVTFHRAVDVGTDPVATVEACRRVGGVSRVLSSGGAASAELGAARIAAMVRAASVPLLDGTGREVPPLTVVAGGGLTPANVGAVVASASVSEVHGSARTVVPGASKHRTDPFLPMGLGDAPDGSRRESTPVSVAAFVRAAKGAET